MRKKGKGIVELRNPYGMKGGKFVHVSEVESGLECGCLCPVTAVPLIARKGSSGMRHHFALSTGSENVSYESFFHRLAKQLIEEMGTITLPASSIWSMQQTTIEVAQSRSYTVTTVLTEKAIAGTGFIADNIVEIGGKEIVIEWRFTHPCEKQKVDAIRKIRIPTVEIDIRELDISATLSKQAEWLLHKAPRHWVYDSRTEPAKLSKWGLRITKLHCSEYVRYFETKKNTFGIRELWVHKCPLHKQTVTIHECRACPYMWGTNAFDTKIECAGASSEKILAKLRSDSGCNAHSPQKWGKSLKLSQIPKDAIRKWKSPQYVEIIRPTEPQDLTLEIDESH